MGEKALSQDELAAIRDNFEFADADGNGRIDFREFSQLVLILAPDAELDRVAEGFSMVDTNSDGAVDFEEFIDWWQTVWWEY